MVHQALTPHPRAARAAARYLAVADRVLPGRIRGFYLVGSTALGAYRPDRSDIDFVAVVDGDLDLRRLRLLHLAANAPSALWALARLRLTLPGTVNGVFVAESDLRTPVTRIRPVASHVGESVRVGVGFDVNPVTWKVLQERGIAVRGPAPDRLGLDPEPGRLREWNLDNLRRYWRSWAEARLRGPGLKARHAGAWGMLGAPRLHHTIATGEIASKEAAGEYALDVFDRRWHPLVRQALAYWRGEPARRVAIRDCAEFVLEVVADAERL
ncbi:aminoglycoside adenylyltransferase domain-containing protein [Thermoactinospora rubra]|uniref:aminoglycoside adenylyltransferase domain-containing protein n=1 Tax=Thermoactinospora rubra TaxID=1088767 RepID=UPI00197EACD2|nr:aminoglycoside adenylyltransferase domain-containing protein [Thermoactinospora rubra]